MKQNKKTFSSELAYLFGIIALAFGTAMMERANLGMSMVVAPAYLVHLKVATVFPGFSFGMAEYCLQAVLLILMIIVLRRFKVMYLFSFVTAVVYGFFLDGFMYLVSLIPGSGLTSRILFFIPGMLMCCLGVAMLFHTYIAPEVYELVVKEVADKFNCNISRVKTMYDCISCMVSVVLSFIFFGFGKFVGVNIGTVITALFNGFIIGKISGLLEREFEFKDCLKIGRKK